MDERIFVCKTGCPIPPWDLRHRLSAFSSVGPDLKDGATIFRINSTYMDVTDQPYLDRQWNCAAVLVACWGACLSAFVIYLFNFSSPGTDTGMLGIIIAVAFGTSMTIFGYLTFKFGRDEYFSLTRRTIRFNRREKKIYAIRRRRFFSKPGEGDVLWTVPWNSESIFCIHKGLKSMDRPYHIRHYITDKNGNVIKAFALGRNWDGVENVEALLAQWNYWCWYMEHGPEELPLPPLFFSEKEDIKETFLFCMYDLGGGSSVAARIILMPIILLMTSFRLLAMWTCRDPKWPESVARVSLIDPNDPYEQPKGDTPVGWAATAISREKNKYPSNPKRKSGNWHGEPDGAINGLKWAEDYPPPM